MEQTVSQLSSRLSKVELEYTLAARKRAEGAGKALKALRDISDEDVELVKSVVPSLAVIRTYTEKDLIENLNGEVECVRRAAADLRDYVEHRLSFYEEQL